jgi:HPt (histidine-containing phosphotransfer) domain-containing protein
MALHRLAGTAGALGFANLTEMARAAMQAASNNEAKKLAHTLAELDTALLAAQTDGS